MCLKMYMIVSTILNKYKFISGLMVIVEYCRYGSIDQYMLKNRNNFLNQFTINGEFIDHDGELKSM